MEYELVKDNDGTIIDILVNGKAVRKDYMRGMRKAQKTSYWHEYTESANGINTWSKVAVPLNPLEYTIFRFCVEWYAKYEEEKDTETPIQTYDDMKYFLMFLNLNAYMELLN